MPNPPLPRRRALALGAGLLTLLLAGWASAQVVPPDPPPVFPPQVGGEWGPVLVWPHVPVSMANLPDGRVLTFASNEPNRFPGSKSDEYTHASVWNPATGEIKNIPHPNHDMFCAALVMLESGEPFVMGGRNQGDSPWTSYFDFWEDEWVQIENMNRGRWYPTAVYLGSGDVFIAAGVGGGVNPERWSPTGGWTLLTGIDLSSSILQFGTRDGSGSWPLLQLAPDGTVFHHGATDVLNTIDPFGGPSDLGTITPLFAHDFGWFADEGVSVSYDDGKILVAGGSVSTSNNTAVAGAWKFDLYQPGLGQQQTGDMNYPRQFQNEVMAPTGEVMVFGGNTSGIKFTDAFAVKNAEAWDPDTDTWTLWNAQDQARTYHSTAVLLPDARVISAGGGLAGDSCANPEGPGECQDDHWNAEIFTPPYLFDPDGSLAARPEILVAPEVTRVGATIQVQATPGLGDFSMVRMSATTHTMNTDQRFLRPSFVETSPGTYELTLHGDRDVLVKGYWMLFALQGRVPSVAHVIQVVDDGVPRGRPISGRRNDVGDTVLLQIDAHDPDGNPLAFSATGLPDGLSIDTMTGVIDGSPTVAGVFNVVVTATDGSEAGQVSFPWIVSTLRSEVGTLAVSSTSAGSWTTVDLGSAFQDPIVVMGPLAGSPPGDPDPATVRIRNVTPTSFEFLIEEWEYLDGDRGPDQLSYLVVEAGEYSLPGGGTLVAGRSLGVDFENPRVQALPAGAFATTPIVLAQVASANSSRVVAPRLSAVGPTEFQVVIQGEEGTSTNLPVEDLHWIALEPAAVPGVLAAALTGNEVTDDPQTQVFDAPFSGVPHLFADMQTFDGSDPAVVRTEAESAGSFDLIIEEEQAEDPETDHTTEVVGWFAIDPLESSLGLLPLFNQAPTVATPEPRTSELDGVVSFFVQASDPDGDTLAFSATGLPAGLAIDPDTGEIQGSPTTTGTFAVTVTATDTSSASSGATFVWTVKEPLQLVAFPTPPRLTGEDIDYGALTNLSGDFLYEWDFGDGGVSGPSSSPEVSHTFAGPGRWIVTLTVTDPSIPSSDQIQFVQNVMDPATPLPPTTSTSIAYEAGADRVWAVNPDNDSVRVIDGVGHGGIDEVPVCDDPRSVAVAGDGRIWVTCKDADRIDILDAGTRQVVTHVPLPFGSQPHGLAFDPTGATAYVVLEAAGRILALDGLSGAELMARDLGAHVRGLAVTADGATIYVSRFVTPPLPGEATGTPASSADGNPLGGEILELDAATLVPVATRILGFSIQPDSEQSGRGVPNYLAAPVVSPQGTELLVPSKQDNLLRGPKRDGLALSHDTTVRAITSRFDRTTNSEDIAARLDHDNASMASAALYHPSGAYAFTLLEGNRQLVVVDPITHFELGRVGTGRAPHGVTISPDGLTLFVDDFMDRSISVYDLSGLLDYDDPDLPLLSVVSKVGAETLSPDVLNGKQLFYDAADPRLTLEAYMACASCHNDGGQDGRVWDFTQFGEGMRNTIGLNGHGEGQGPVHWTANFDEIQDFEGQIRGFVLGEGLMDDADFADTSDPLGSPKAGLSPDLDDLAAYVGSLVEEGRSPHRSPDGTLTPEAVAGQTVFLDSGCNNCHGGTEYTDSADPEGGVHDVGTLEPGTSGPVTALDTPTLRGLFDTGPYLHDGSAATVAEAVLEHDGVSLTEPELSQLVAFLLQVDEDEPSAPNRAPVVETPADVAYRVGREVPAFGVVADDLDGNPVSYQAANLPSGITIDPDTGWIQGTAQAGSEGTYSVEVEVSDGFEVSLVSFQWTVVAKPSSCGLGAEALLALPLLLRLARRRRRA